MTETCQSCRERVRTAGVVTRCPRCGAGVVDYFPIRVLSLAVALFALFVLTSVILEVFLR